MSTIFLILIILLSSCIVEQGKIEISLKQKAPTNLSNVKVAQVKIENNQLVIVGNNLTDIKNVHAINQADQSKILFSIVSKSAEKIIANSNSNSSFLIKNFYNLVLSNADAQTVYPISFSLCDSKLNDKPIDCSVIMNDKDVLSYDAMTQTWKPRAVNGLQYMGSFDASSGVAPTIRPAGAYFIISVAGTISSINFNVGDWIVSNGSAYQKIDNSSAITNVFGRTGVVTATEGDYSLNLLSDVDLTVAPTAGKVLKYDGTKWIADDDLSGGGAGTVSSAEITDGAIATVDIANNAITNAKINDVAAGKITGTLTGAQIGAGVITNSHISGTAAIDYSKLNIPNTTIPYAKLNIADGDIPFAKVTGISTAIATYIEDAIVNGVTTKAPSQNVVYDQLQTKLNTTGGTLSVGTINGVPTPVNADDVANKGYADLKVSKAGDTMSGDLNLDTQLKLKGTTNYVTLKATSATNAYTLTLPDTAGTSGYVLSTNGSGILSWLDPGTFGSKWSENAGNINRSSGNVGIGVVNPTSSLDILTPANTTGIQNTGYSLTGSNSQSQINLTGTWNTTGTPSLIKANVTDTASNANSKLIDLQVSGAPRFNVGKNGAVLIQGSAGSTATSSNGVGNLLLSSSGVEGRIQATSGSITPGWLSFYTATVGSTATEKVRIDALGNLGVGVTSPVSKLDVAGSIKLGADAGLTCDGTTAGAMRFNSPNVQYCNGTAWTAFSTAAAGSVTSTEINDGTIVDADVSGSAAIAQSKIANLTTDLAAKQSLDATLTALAGYNTNGIMVQTASDTFVGRSIAGTANRVGVTNGDGVTGNPTINIDTSLLPSPIAGDAGKFLKASGANTSSWQAIASSDVTTALGFTPINKGGDTISSGTLLFNGTALLSVPTPVNLTDAVNKQYVDTAVSSGSNQWTHDSGNVYRSSGNVGIGNTNPLSSFVIGSSIGSGYAITANSTTPYGAVIQTSEATPTANAALWVRNTVDSGSTNQTLFRVQNNGNVSAGTSLSNIAGANANSRVLTIAGDGTTTNARGVLELANSRAVGSLASGDKAGDVYFSMANNQGLALVGGISTLLDGVGGANGFGGKLVFQTKADNSTTYSNRMVIDSAGNVGVGTFTPSSKFTMDLGNIANSNTTTLGQLIQSDATTFSGFSGTRYILNNSTSNYTGFVRAARTAGTTYIGLEIGSETNHGIRFLTNGNSDSDEKMRISSSGNVGIGTASSTAKLVIDAGTSNNFAIRDNSIENHKTNGIASVAVNYFGYNGGTTQFRDFSIYDGKTNQIAHFDGTNARFGVGTGTPTSKLHVNGDIRYGSHLKSQRWYGSGNRPQGTWVPGYFKLKTPILKNEENFFKIKILGYRYGAAGLPFEINCGGYAYSLSTLVSAKCHTDGIKDHVGIAVDTDDKVYISIGDGTFGTWYYDYFSFEYTGTVSKAESDFTWEWVYNTAPTTTNTNRVFVSDMNGYVWNNRDSGGANLDVYSSLDDGLNTDYAGFGVQPASRKFSIGAVGTGLNGWHQFVVDLTSGYAGFGLAGATPVAAVEVKGGPTMTGGWNRTLRLEGTHPTILFKGAGQETKTAWIAYDDATSSNGISFWANGTSNDMVTDSTRIMTVRSNGNVGIGTMDPTYTLHVNGSVAGTSAYNNLSDKRLKKNIVKIPDSLEKILSLEGVFYHFRVDEYEKLKLSNRREIGVIAQDLEKVFPEAVSTNKDGIKSVAYSMLIAPIIESIKEIYEKYLVPMENEQREIKREVASVKMEFEKLKNENAKLKKENSEIKTYLCKKDLELAKSNFCKN